MGRAVEGKEPIDVKMAERLTKLEILVAHQQKTLETMNEVVVDHTTAMLKIERLLARIENTVREMRREATERSRDPRDEKPPHY
ncbi:MAG: SlyX family protein [Pirellulaceae bacterium]